MGRWVAGSLEAPETDGAMLPCYMLLCCVPAPPEKVTESANSQCVTPGAECQHPGQRRFFPIPVVACPAILDPLTLQVTPPPPLLLSQGAICLSVFIVRLQPSTTSHAASVDPKPSTAPFSAMASPLAISEQDKPSQAPTRRTHNHRPDGQALAQVA